MESFVVTAEILRFDGPNGWFYVPMPAEQEVWLRPLVVGRWPALLPIGARIDDVAWEAKVMPIKGGPLFVAIPARVRKRLGVGEGDEITLALRPLELT